MVALRSNELDTFCQDPDPRYPVALIYGPNRGLVSERVQTLLASVRANFGKDSEVVVLEGDALASDPGRLADETRSIGLFGGKRALHVRAGSRSFADSLKALFADVPSETFVLIEGGDLAKNAPLRSLCEASPKCAVIPCYEDDARQLGALIDSSLLREGKAIDRDARETLLSLVGADRLATRAEIEKLIFYVGDANRITLDDVRAVVADASALAIDDVVDAAAAGDAKAALRALARAREAGTSAGSLLNAAIRHVSQLHRIALQMEAGERNVDELLKRARVFFRRSDAYKRALKRFGSLPLEKVLVALGEAELESRRSAHLSDSIVERAILSLAERGKSRAA
ncbi:MAG: DNA polymerase III subunit delta [Xanthobacteraceae bacterium]|nr:DNA polymerase III subunit delta [Xanthobacteraceae bacterium]QYK44981.1 MAG: DNA polymerase III subunit delta [Xanthobacteraceae bacterium]HMN51155.1 DNA polymerase III subunit delta [Xanthobacteraceae bacterium]